MLHQWRIFVVNGSLLDHQLINSIDPIDSMDLGLLTTKKLLHQLTNGSINKQWINLLETFAINFQWIMSIANSALISYLPYQIWQSMLLKWLVGEVEGRYHNW